MGERHLDSECEGRFAVTGTFPMNVDGKARITFPSPFRKEIDKRIKLVPFQGCVYGFTPEGFDSWVDGLFENGDRHYNPRDHKDDRLRRGLNASAVDVDIDSAGRIALGKLDVAKPGRREALGLVGEVMVIGNGDHFEAWNADKWRTEQESFEDDLEALMFGA